MKNTRFNLISSIISMLICLFLLVFVIFAWYTANDTVKATGITGMTASEDCIHFKDTVTAKRYGLSGSTEENTYTKQSDGSLLLTRQVIYDASTGTITTITSFEEDTYFSITELLPGEYVDITLGYYMDSQCNGYNYNLKLKNIIADSFKVDYNGVDYTHYVSGAFKYKSMSLKDEEGETPANFTPASNFTWFSSYNISQNDSETVEVDLLHHTWLNSYEALYYTFRISEDFTQYYQLIGQSTVSYGNLLSRKRFRIGSVYLMF